MDRAAELTWTEVKTRAPGAVALLPVGSTEAHGPHLPLGTDVFIAEGVCDRVGRLLEARGQRAVQFPPLWYGLTEFARGFPGTVSVPGATVTALLAQAVEGILEAGFSRVALVNHHLEPAHFAAVKAAAEAAKAKGLQVACPDHRRKPWALELGEEFCRGGSHAGFYETSLVLASRPEVVRAARMDLPDLAIDLAAKIKAGAASFAQAGGPEAYFGSPRSATVEDGERLLGVLARMTVAALDELG
jgi:creatinine amidohydrolase